MIPLTNPVTNKHSWVHVLHVALRILIPKVATLKSSIKAFASSIGKTFFKNLNATPILTFFFTKSSH